MKNILKLAKSFRKLASHPSSDKSSELLKLILDMANKATSANARDDLKVFSYQDVPFYIYFSLGNDQEAPFVQVWEKIPGKSLDDYDDDNGDYFLAHLREDIDLEEVVKMAIPDIINYMTTNEPPTELETSPDTERLGHS